ncbi:MAG: hypothetical protein R2822_00705 [Spirosomataceae bacterium]
MKAVKEEGGKYFGQRGDDFYFINDEQAHYFYEKWQGISAENVAVLVQDILSNTTIWDTDLTKLAGFAEAITSYLIEMMNNGVKAIP